MPIPISNPDGRRGFTGIDGKLIVYARILRTGSLKYMKLSMIQVLTLKSKVLKKYGDHNSSDPAVMKNDI